MQIVERDDRLIRKFSHGRMECKTCDVSFRGYAEDLGAEFAMKHHNHDVEIEVSDIVEEVTCYYCDEPATLISEPAMGTEVPVCSQSCYNSI